MSRNINDNCYRLNLITKYNGTEHIIVGSTDSAEDMVKRIKEMDPESIIDWGDRSVIAKDIIEFRIEETKFWKVS